MKQSMDESMDQFLSAAHRAGNEKLMLCSSGNLSLRVSEKILLSGTGSWLPTITKEQVAILDLKSGKTLNGVKPSIEHKFHLEVLRNRPDINVVFHFQSEYATVIACLKKKPTNFNVTLEVPLYLGNEIPILPFYLPGSAELAEGVAQAMASHDVCLLSKHGQVVCGTSLDDAFQKACFLEMACRIMVLSNMDYDPLTEAEAKAIEALNK
jgi:Ribulose-5-phosphate 4-epimerase and related epimerases and aldolases